MVKTKILIAALGLSLTAGAHAAYPYTSDTFELPPAPPFVVVSIPQQTGSFSIAGEALFHKPGNDYLQYATTSLTDTVLNTTDSANKVHEFDPAYYWGWSFDAVYHFPGHGQDIEFKWTHIQLRSTERRAPVDGGLLLGPSILNPNIFTGTFSNGWDTVTASSKNNYDAVDLVFGQKLDFTNRLTLRTFGGIRYAGINLKDLLNYRAIANDGLGGVDETVLSTSAKSKFQGIGPRAGVDTSFRISKHMSLVGTIAGSLLTGNLDQKSGFLFNSFDDSGPLLTTVASDFKPEFNSILVVPALDARMGVEFVYPVRPEVALTFQAGYDVSNYFGVKHTSLADRTDIVDHTNNYVVQGPYLRIQADII